MIETSNCARTQVYRISPHRSRIYLNKTIFTNRNEELVHFSQLNELSSPWTDKSFLNYLVYTDPTPTFPVLCMNAVPVSIVVASRIASTARILVPLTGRRGSTIGEISQMYWSSNRNVPYPRRPTKAGHMSVISAKLNRGVPV